MENMEEKVREYCNKLGVEYGDLFNKNHTSQFVDKKHLIWHKLRQDGHSYVSIRKEFGYKNHNAVLWGDRKIKKLIEVRDKKIMELVKLLTCK